MKKDNQSVSRRTFLAAGSAVAASSVLLTNKEAEAAPTSNKGAESENKITAQAMVATAEYINIRDLSSFPQAPIRNITQAIKDAIDMLTPGTLLNTSNRKGGQILIPGGRWESSGEHLLTDSISIEGVGSNQNTGSQYGTIIEMIGSNEAMFRITGAGASTDGIRNCSLKNLAVDMVNCPDATGLLMKNTTIKIIYGTHVENVTFNRGKYGIKVESDIPPDQPNSPKPEFECILNKFDRVTFHLCKVGFSCNTVNGGYTFDNCYFKLLSAETLETGQIALECIRIGNLSLKHCHFAGPFVTANTAPSNNATVLYTKYEFNNINFYDCQDENIEYAYRNESHNSIDVPLVYRNCLIQSRMKFNAQGTVIFDSCRLNATARSMRINDSPPPASNPNNLAGAYVKVILQGTTSVFRQVGNVYKIDEFSNKYSYIVGGNPIVAPKNALGNVAGFPPGGAIEIHAPRGAVNIKNGLNYIYVYNSLVDENTLVTAFKRGYDAGSAEIRDCIAYNGYFVIALTSSVQGHPGVHDHLSVGFVVEIATSVTTPF